MKKDWESVKKVKHAVSAGVRGPELAGGKVAGNDWLHLHLSAIVQRQ